MDYYNVSLHGFFFYQFFSFFFPNSLCRFFFVIFSLKHCGLLQCFLIWFLFAIVFPHMFFSKIIFIKFFFNIELVENSALTFPTCFFSIFSICFAFFFLPKLSSSFFFNFLCFFFIIVFVDFIFLI